MLRAAKNGGGLPIITLNVTSDQSAVYNAFTAAGSPSYACKVIINVASGVICKSGVSITGFATGSSASLINAGTIAGTPGNGGSGIYASGTHINYLQDAVPTTGGNAINTAIPIIVDNTSGNIFGGGGGGAGGMDSMGPSGVTVGQAYAYAVGRGGGGGGRGYKVSSGYGGLGGYTGLATGYPGSPGSDGSEAAPGTGGAGGLVVSPPEIGGYGGDGGDWGATGSSANPQLYTYWPSGSYAVPTGAAGGNAVKLNGNAITWIGGNNSTQVKGAVS